MVYGYGGRCKGQYILLKTMLPEARRDRGRSQCGVAKTGERVSLTLRCGNARTHMNTQTPHCLRLLHG